MWHTCQLILIVSLDIINNNQIRCYSLGFCNVTGTFIYVKTIKISNRNDFSVECLRPIQFYNLEYGRIHLWLRNNVYHQNY